jgi:hypothetical protein
MALEMDALPHHAHVIIGVILFFSTLFIGVLVMIRQTDRSRVEEKKK